ncbi:MAG TPA: urease subunit gamma [Candidatus Limnocylindrales bacterium]
MRLTAWEEERLLIFSAAELARRHRAAGLQLNAPEAVALIADAMLEAGRAGATYAAVEAAGAAAVAPADVLPGVAELVDDVRVEVLFGDGPRLVVLVAPLGGGAADGGPGAIRVGDPDEAEHDDWMLAPAALERREVRVENTSRRAVRVSSHYPFDQVNPRLRFERSGAAGFRLDIPAGSSERWAPGETRTVRLVRVGPGS